MKNNVLNLVRFLPKWKILMYILISFLLAVMTGITLLLALLYLEDNSRLFKSLFFILSYFPVKLIYLVLNVVTTGLYLLLFYQFERKRYLAFYIKKVTEDVQLLVKKERTSTEISAQPEFQALAEEIQKIIAKSEEAIKEVKMAEQIKNELVTNVAHDLRSPLTSIIGYLDLINNDRYRDEVELRYYVQVIHDKAASLHALINDIFVYTYMQNQHINLGKESVHIEEMLNQLAVQSRMQLEEAGMECRVYSSEKNQIVAGDGRMLARVFENLFQNAIRYGSDDKYLDVRISDTEKTVEVEVVNYGQAIPGSDLPHIFERFYRVEKSRSHFTGGSGLGLAIAKSVVDLHDGHIEVMSTPGRTAFTIKLLKKE